MTNSCKFSNVRKLIVTPAALMLLGTVTLASGGERQVHVQGGKMATRMVNGKMILTGVQGKVGGGQVHMAGRVAVDSEKSNNATVKFDDLSLAEAAEMVGYPKTGSHLDEATISGFAKGRWQGEGLKEIASSANGTLTVESGPGVITDTAVLERLAEITGIANLEELRYSNVKLRARAADGKITIDSITASGPNFKLSAKGVYAAGDDNLEMHIEASVSPEMAAKSSYMKFSNVMGFLRGEEKPETGEFIKVPTLIVSGELKKLDVRMEKTDEVASKAETKEVKPAVADSVKRVSSYLLSQAQ